MKSAMNMQITNITNVPYRWERLEVWKCLLLNQLTSVDLHELDLAYNFSMYANEYKYWIKDPAQHHQKCSTNPTFDIAHVKSGSLDGMNVLAKAWLYSEGVRRSKHELWLALSIALIFIISRKRVRDHCCKNDQHSGSDRTPLLYMGKAFSSRVCTPHDPFIIPNKKAQHKGLNIIA